LDYVGGDTITIGQNTMNNSLPVVLASDQTALTISNFPETQSVTGSVITYCYDFDGNPIYSTSNALNVSVKNFSQGTATLFSSATVTNGVESSYVDLHATPYTQLSIYGNTSTDITLTLKMSNDGVTGYNSQYSVSVVGSGDFGFSVSCSARYVSLIGSGISTSAVVTSYLDWS
jgi:hypothetical protein